MASKGIVIDLTGVEAFVKMPVGMHEVAITEASIEQAKSSENKLLVVVFEHESGANVKYRLALTKNALWKLKQFLEAIGEKGLDGKYKLEPDKLIGKKCMIKVEEEEYDGKMYAKVEECLKISKPAGKPVDSTPEADDDDDFEELL